MCPYNPWEHNLSFHFTKTIVNWPWTLKGKWHLIIKAVRLFQINTGLLFFFFFSTYKWVFFFTSYTHIPWFPCLVLKKVNKSAAKAGRCCSALSAITGFPFELRMEHSASADGHWSVYDVKNLARNEVSMHQPEKILFCLGFFGHFCLSFPSDGFLTLCQFM